ncbi:MAG: hypothetical protein N2560_10355, partial [Ignavibacteria bacterium]|nr:hypothetical protein [Ignavibacteria bacterium]
MKIRQLDMRVLINPEGVITPFGKISFMHFFLLLFLALTFSFSNLYSTKLELLPLCINYYGVESSKGNIIIYGNFGTYLISNNNAKSWKRCWIGNFESIFHIVNYKDTLWGILGNGYIISSTDGGEHWVKNKIEIENGDKTLRLIVTDEAFYVRGIQTIYLYDRNFKKISKIQDTLLKVFYKEVHDPGYPYPLVNLNDYDFYYFFDKLIVLSNFTNSGFFLVDKNLSKINLVNPCELISIYKDTNSKNSCNVNKIFLYKGKLVFQLKSENLYVSNEDFTKWEYFFRDTNFLNFRDTANIKRWKEIVNPLGYYSDGKNLFCMVLKNWEYKGKILAFGIVLKKFISSPKDTFIVSGNNFIDSYMKTTFSPPGYRHDVGIGIYMTKDRRFGVFNDSIHIFVHDKSYIFLTTNSGKNWGLISFLNGKPNNILNDTVYFFVYPSSGNAEVCRTFDGGYTFLPNKRYFPGDTSFKNANYLQVKVFFIDSSGIGFLTGSQSSSPYYFTVTENFWDSTVVVPTSIAPYSSNFTSNVSPINNKYYFALNDTANNNYYYSLLYYETLNKKFHLLGWDSLSQNYSSVIKGTNSTINYIIPNGSIADFIAFSIVNDTNYIYKNRFEIRHTLDSGRTFTTV